MSGKHEVTIANVTTAVVEYKGQRVCLTSQMAEIFGCDENNIRVNFHRNQDRFEEGKHFFKLEGAELKKLKNDYVTICNVVADRAPHAILWTERGAANHAKMLNTDKAWSMYEEMAEVYFAFKEMSDMFGLPENDTPARVSMTKQSCEIATIGFKLAKIFGYRGNQAILYADKMARITTGISPLEIGGATHLIADPRGLTYTPTDLGKMRGISGMAFNKLLEQHGFQIKTANGAWVPTEKAESHYEWNDTNKKHSDGTPVKQLRWFETIDELLPKMSEA